LARSFFCSAAAAIALATAAGSIAAAPALGAEVESTRPALASEAVQFEIFFPLRDPAGLQALLQDQQTPGTADYQRWLTPTEFTRRFGADPAILAQAGAILTKAGFTVTATHAQGIRVAGTAGLMRAQFGTSLEHVADANGRDSLVARAGVTLPAELRAMGAMTVAFGANHKQIYAKRIGHAVPLNRNSATGGYWFSDLKQAYDAPSYESLAGNGRNIAILMGSDVQDSDMELYFGHENLPEPTLIHIAVNGGGPFSTSNDDSLEATLDVQQSGGMAPLATILMYNTPALDDADLLDGLAQINSDNLADVVSMSFGECELFFTAAYNSGVDMTSTVTAFEQQFLQGNAQGITFVASSGDNGALQCPSLTKPIFIAGASHPATSPSVTAVGGTNLVTKFTKGSENSAYVSENANGDPLVAYSAFGGSPLTGGIWGSGGGPSIFFPTPSWQSSLGIKKRATPDLSLHMGGCPDTAQLPCGPQRSYDIEIFGGEVTGVIGTSASAPAFAGVVALYDELTGARHGNLGPMIYKLAGAQGLNSNTAVFRRAIPGFNGLYYSGVPVAIPGIVVPSIGEYNMVIGTGTLDIRQFLGAANLPPAGVPGSLSNP
jgi:subtilase family serine protease